MHPLKLESVVYSNLFIHLFIRFSTTLQALGSVSINVHVKTDNSSRSRCPGGVKVTCEYKTHQEGVLQEQITLITKGRKENSLKVRLQAKVIGKSCSTHQRLDRKINKN